MSGSVICHVCWKQSELGQELRPCGRDDCPAKDRPQSWQAFFGLADTKPEGGEFNLLTNTIVGPNK